MPRARKHTAKNVAREVDLLTYCSLPTLNITLFLKLTYSCLTVLCQFMLHLQQNDSIMHTYVVM